MNQKDVVTTIKNFIEKKFPRECTCCGKRYNSLADYVRNTTRQGKMTSYGAEQVTPNPKKPLGALAMANCSCGSTMALSSDGMDSETLWKLADWVLKEREGRGTAIEDVLEEVRQHIIKEVLPGNFHKAH